MTRKDYADLRAATFFGADFLVDLADFALVFAVDFLAGAFFAAPLLAAFFPPDLAGRAVDSPPPGRPAFAASTLARRAAIRSTTVPDVGCACSGSFTSCPAILASMTSCSASRYESLYW